MSVTFGAAAVGILIYKTFFSKAKCVKPKVNLDLQKDNPKVVHAFDIEDLGDKAVYCRCWRSKNVRTNLIKTYDKLPLEIGLKLLTLNHWQSKYRNSWIKKCEGLFIIVHFPEHVQILLEKLKLDVLQKPSENKLSWNQEKCLLCKYNTYGCDWFTEVLTLNLSVSIPIHIMQRRAQLSLTCPCDRLLASCHCLWSWVLGSWILFLSVTSESSVPKFHETILEPQEHQRQQKGNSP